MLYVMRTVRETDTFRKLADQIWTEDERLDFIEFIAQSPLLGDVVPQAGGARKVRWSVKGSGKRGGVRVIYFNVSEEMVELIYIYKKVVKSNMTGQEIKRVQSNEY